MTEWDIQPRSHACTACEQPFADKQTYHTLLSMTVSGYERRDLCPVCYPAAPRKGVVSYWQGEYKKPAAPPPEPIQKDTAETLLRKLVESTDPGHAAARYILAVMLERKRILKHRDTVDDVLVYEHAGTGESFAVPDPHLQLDQLEDVQTRIAELLTPSEKETEVEPSADSAPVASAS